MGLILSHRDGCVLEHRWNTHFGGSHPRSRDFNLAGDGSIVEADIAVFVSLKGSSLDLWAPL